ncbi:MAG: flagellar hook-associated protein FlgK [Devosiaceae bacterium]|nr:flagellar hook-associated protein FlgK [Devosiaceae bacterium]
MSLTAALSNALSGMGVTQSGLEILARNVANSGTPGYNAQSQNLVESNGANSSSVRSSGVARAFDAALQQNYTDQVSNSGYARTRADFLSQLETLLGKPGDASSLDNIYSGFQSAMEAMATSPDSYATRAAAISSAETLANRLNSISSNVQNLRRDSESQIRNLVNGLNSDLSNLRDVNSRLAEFTQDTAARSALLDERDRLVASIGEVVDVNATYRDNGSVRLLTRSGVGLLDQQQSVFGFEAAGSLSANSLYSNNPSESGVGALTLRTSSGLPLDIVGQGILQSGKLGALVELRDSTLVQVQSQLDDIAASLAQSLSNINVASSSVSVGAQNGFEVDLAALQPGNSFTLNYTEGGNSETVRVMRVDDASLLPMDNTGSDGVRVIGLDFSGGIGAVAASLNASLGVAINVSNPSGSILRVLDDGALATSNIDGLSASYTAGNVQDGNLALPLFVDTANSAFTNSLDAGEQKIGFAGRISINSAVKLDNSLMVQFSATSSLGDASRANDIIDRLNNSSFVSDVTSTKSMGQIKLEGNVGALVSQMLSFQGASVEKTQSVSSTNDLSMEALSARMEEKYGVDIDKEMAMLMEMQTAYAANARVLSAVQELLNTLMRI